MGVIDVLKKEYNDRIELIRKGDRYIENPKVPLEKIEKEGFLKRYDDIIVELSRLQLEYKSITGSEMQTDNKLNGF